MQISGIWLVWKYDPSGVETFQSFHLPFLLLDLSYWWIVKRSSHGAIYRISSDTFGVGESTKKRVVFPKMTWCYNIAYISKTIPFKIGLTFEWVFRGGGRGASIFLSWQLKKLSYDQYYNYFKILYANSYPVILDTYWKRQSLTWVYMVLR